MTLTITIPGEPVAQGRPRAFRRGAHVVVTDPTKSRSWKSYATGRYEEALAAAGLAAPAFGDDAVVVELVAYFACPTSKHLKRGIRPACPKTGKPDVDNLLKAALDAGNGVLWVDDSRVCSARVTKLVAAQGEPPRVELRVRRVSALVPAP